MEGGRVDHCRCLPTYILQLGGWREGRGEGGGAGGVLITVDVCPHTHYSQQGGGKGRGGGWWPVDN